MLESTYLMDRKSGKPKKKLKYYSSFAILFFYVLLLLIFSSFILDNQILKRSNLLLKGELSHLFELPTLKPIIKIPVSRKIRNITAFAKMYGYVKYFYPGDEVSSIDMKRFAIYGCQKVENAKNDLELIHILNELFSPIAPSSILYLNFEKASFSQQRIVPPDTFGCQVVSWQYSGLGPSSLVSKSPIYYSRRLNTEECHEICFEEISRQLPVDKLRSKKVRLKTTIKIEPTSTGKCRVFLEVINLKGHPSYITLNLNHSKLDSNWLPIEMIGVVDSTAKSVSCRVQLNGGGKMTLKQLTLAVFENGNWGPGTELLWPKDNKPVISPSMWEVKSNSTDYKIKIDSILGDKRLSIEAPLHIMLPSLFKSKSSIGDYFRAKLSDSINCILPLALYKYSGHTYPIGNIVEMEFLKSKLAIIDTNIENVSGRLANLVILWSVFNNFYPYIDDVRANLTEGFEVAIKSTYTDINAFDYLNTLELFSARLDDGHVTVGYKNNILNNFFPPFKWAWIENQLVVTEVDSPGLHIRPGDIVKLIDGISVNEVLLRKEKSISSSTEEWRRYRALRKILTGDSNTKIVLSVKHYFGEDIVNDTILRYRKVKPTSFFYNEKDAFKNLGSGLYYLNMSILSRSQLDSLLPILCNSQGLICDMRGYPNKNIYFLSHLMNIDDTCNNWNRTPQITRPNFENVTYHLQGFNVKRAEPHINAKIVFLIDNRCISLTESWLSFVEHYKLGTIIGEPTAGTDGVMNSTFLFGGYYVTWTGMQVFKLDGTPFRGVGIKPEIYVHNTIKGIINHKDEALERALQLFKQKK